MLTWQNFDERFRAIFQRAPDLLVRAPGRINLIGEHIDYNGGIVLPMAIEREVRAAFAVRPNVGFTLHSLQESFVYEGPLPPDARNLGWTAYVFGVIHEFLKAGIAVPGLDILVDSDLPVSSGLSSSAAIGVAAAYGLQRLLRTSMTGLELAMLAQRSENIFVGVQCGLMDQAIVVLGHAGYALELDCATLETRHAPLRFSPPTAIVVAHSGVRRGLSASEYNKRRSECEEALAIINAALPERRFRNLCAVPAEVLPQSGLTGVLAQRARHVVSEQSRVRKAVAALYRGNAQEFGKLLDESHESLRADYEVSCAELDDLTAWLRRQPGVYGARLTGAGFGGSTVSIVDKNHAEGLITALTGEFYPSRGLDALCFLSTPSQGASVVAHASDEHLCAPS